ncbi:MAG TPA: hypothetical protein VFJ85_02725 [Acidimicrobiales bacterium]|nr:hypothetical protein [Acidimicrobiales bacterium]
MANSRKPWRRTFTYRQEKVPSPGTFNVPVSTDAPYEERDARFWNRVALVLVVLLICAGAAFVLAR